MKEINPYLNFNGNCEEAFNFYADTLGGKIAALFRHAGTPMEEHVSEDWKQKVMHARLEVDAAVLLGSDSPPEYYKPAQGSYVTISLKDPAEAERIFAAFTEGGHVIMAIEKTFWAERFGMVVDRFGTPWMINCEASG